MKIKITSKTTGHVSYLQEPGLNKAVPSSRGLRIWYNDDSGLKKEYQYQHYLYKDFKFEITPEDGE
jgi:hypothetical protein